MMRSIPALILDYGSSGVGKTTNALYSFPNALFIGTRGAFHSSVHLCGYTPTTVDAKTIADATAKVREVSKNGKHDAVVVDDFSFLAEQTIALYEKKYSGFKMWSAIRDDVLGFRNTAREANCHVLLNCWQKSPQTKPDGTFVRGGPMLSGKLPEQLPAMCDMVLQCSHDSMRKPWGGVYKCEQSTRWVMKDRFNICYSLSPAPMNTSEILRAAGYTISRHKDLPWQEKVVEEFSQRLDAAGHALYDTANTLFAQLIQAGIEHKAARWTLRDALDRVVIRRALQSTSTRFIA